MNSDRDERREFPRRGFPDGPEDGTLVADTVSWSCVVHNVSAGGALLVTDAPLTPGARVTLEVAGLPPVRAEVVRADRDGLGVRFIDGPEYLFR